MGVYSSWDSFLLKYGGDLYTQPTQRSAWKWPYNWAENVSEIII